MATRTARRTPRWLLPLAVGFVCGFAASALLPHHLDRRSRASAMEGDRRSGSTDAVDAPHPADLPTLSPASREPGVLAEPASAAVSAARTLEERHLLVPVEGVAAASLVGSFADARGSSRRHEAIDIPAPRGTPVRAVDDGRIARLFTSEAGGLTVYQFDRDAEWVYYYAHLDGYAPGLAEEDGIRRGQILGYVGTTGNAPAALPHLHFAIMKLTADRRWWEGTAVDPYPLLRVAQP